METEKKLSSLVQTCNALSKRVNIVKHSQKLAFDNSHKTESTLNDREKKLLQFSEVLQDLAPQQKNLKRFNRAKLVHRLKQAAKLKRKPFRIDEEKIARDERRGFLPFPRKLTSADGTDRFRGYDINDILEILSCYDLLPNMNDHLKRGNKLLHSQPIITSISMLKGGSSKTTTSIHYAQFLASLGHKVLMVDVDPQGSMTFQSGYTPDFDIGYADTLAPFILNDQITIEQKIRQINQVQHDTSMFSRDWVERLTNDDLRYCIKSTSISSLDIIPACLSNNILNQVVPTLIANGVTSEKNVCDRLRLALKSLDEYEFIVIDGIPSLGFTSAMYYFISDITVSPIPSRMPDFVSATQHFNMLKNMITEHVKDYKDFRLPTMTAFVARFNTSRSSNIIEKFIRDSFNYDLRVFDNGIERYSAVDACNALGLTVYEAPTNMVNAKSLKKAINGYNELFTEILEYSMNSVFCEQINTSVSQGTA